MYLNIKHLLHVCSWLLCPDEEDAEDITKGFRLELVDPGTLKLFLTDGFGVNFEFMLQNLDSERIKR